jgi:hypothetical protein
MDSSSDDDDHDYNIVNTGKNIPIKYIVTMCDQLIALLEQCPGIIEQEIMAVHSETAYTETYVNQPDDTARSL